VGKGKEFNLKRASLLWHVGGGSPKKRKKRAKGGRNQGPEKKKVGKRGGLEGKKIPQGSSGEKDFLTKKEGPPGGLKKPISQVY